MTRFYHFLMPDGRTISTGGWRATRVYRLLMSNPLRSRVSGPWQLLRKGT